jgi:3-oxoacyl-(acyl-carrier-protein) synthase
VPISSVKSNIGHLCGAAGTVEIAASLMMMCEGVIPATINYTEPDPECDLDYVTGGPRQARFETFMKNSFGFGGQNACLILGRRNGH